MIKETTVKKDVTEQHKFCDVCGAEIHIGLSCNAVSCEYCKRDLCSDCIGHNEDGYGEYVTAWCKDCWALGEYYRPKIEELRDEIEGLYDAWKSKCGEMSE